MSSWAFPIARPSIYAADMGSYSQTKLDDKSRTQRLKYPSSQTFLGLEPYVDAEEAGDFVKIKSRRLKDMARAGAVPAHPLDPYAQRKEWRFLLSELSAWMQNNSGKNRRN